MATCIAQNILDIAKKEIGVKESPAGSNNVKYNTAYYGRAVKDTASTKYPWCCVFVWWLFQQANAKELFYNGGKTASCTTLMRYAKSNGNWVTSGFKPGDLILFNWSKEKTSADHIGVCESVDGNYITCIEGNTSLTNQDNGGCVMLRKRNKNLVVGAYRPKYAFLISTGGSSPSATPAANNGSNKKEEVVSVNLPVLKKGSNNNSVKALQAMLNGYGYDCGKVDGDFGTKTDTALKKYQKAKGLTADGSCGPKTWNSLLGL